MHINICILQTLFIYLFIHSSTLFYVQVQKFVNILAKVYVCVWVKHINGVFVYRLDVCGKWFQKKMNWMKDVKRIVRER